MKTVAIVNPQSAGGRTCSPVTAGESSFARRDPVETLRGTALKPRSASGRTCEPIAASESGFASRDPVDPLRHTAVNPHSAGGRTCEPITPGESGFPPRDPMETLRDTAGVRERRAMKTVAIANPRSERGRPCETMPCTVPSAKGGL